MAMEETSHASAAPASLTKPSSTASLIKKLEQEQVVAVMGGQWGDEGKGKLVDILGGNYDIIARCAGGSNAGK